MNNKKLFYIIVALLVLAAVIWALSFDREPQASLEERLSLQQLEQAVIMEKVEIGDYIVISEESSLLWEAGKTMVANYKNQGSIDILEGSFSLNEEGEISSGALVFDMTSLQVITMTTAGANASLERHLKSDDFFSVEQYPQAELIIYPSITIDDDLAMLYNLEASLTMKGISQDIESPVVLYQANNQVIVEGTIDLDRTLWDIRYGSDKFFDNLANNVIDDFFTVAFKIVAEKY